MPKKPLIGRASIYRGKTTNVHGRITTKGAAQFERARRHLLQKFERDDVSDGDVIEWLAWYWAINQNARPLD